jgi:hypothetical protein
LRGLSRRHHGAAGDGEWVEDAKLEPEEVDELDVAVRTEE